MVTSANEEVVTAEVDGDLVTLTAVEGQNNAQGVVYVRDKYYQRAKILVNTAAEFELKLNKTLFTLYSQVEGADEAIVKSIQEMEVIHWKWSTKIIVLRSISLHLKIRNHL